ncbi:MAG TPA: ATP-binding protein, partial [Ramlibacter sp.]
FFRERSTELQPTGLADLVAEAVHSQSRRAEELGVVLEQGEHRTLPPVWVDRVQIAVVLRNLVANGIEAACEQRHRPHAAPSVSIAIEQQADEAVVSVVDNGPGLTPEQARAVFETPASSKPGGMGIGLSISRAIVEAHGGRLWAEPGPGGTFRFSLPFGTGATHEP